jgi:hypothetical protein
VKQKDSEDKPIFGMLSGRELFYFLFSIGALAIGLFIASIYWSDHQDAKNEKEAALSLNSRRVAAAMNGTGGYVFAETKMLFYDVWGNDPDPKYQWQIYDAKNDEITDGSYLAKPFKNAGKYGNALTNWFHLSGWKGNIVLTVSRPPPNLGPLSFQWRTNENKFSAFQWADFPTDLKHPFEGFATACEHGWLYSDVKDLGVRVIGDPVGEIVFTNFLPTNFNRFTSSPFEGGDYVTAASTGKQSVGIFVLSLTNRSLVFSNISVKMPVSFDELFSAEPDPSGKHVFWTFVCEPKLAQKLHDVTPPFLRSGRDPEPTVYFYSSDLHATKFDLIFSAKIDGYSRSLFMWGVNGDSIWLADADKGIKQYPLK